MTAREQTTAEGECHICSLVITVRPLDLTRVSREISQLPGAEVAIRDPAGKLIVALETVAESGIVAALTQIESIRGVIAAALVFHQVEDQEGGEPPHLAAKETTQ